MSLNKWIGIGNLGRDAELRYLGDGTAVLGFSLACNEVWTDKAGQRQERVEWVRCSYWGKPAEAVAQYMTKGKQVCVEGRMQTRKWKDKEGVDRSTTEIRADRVHLLGGSPGGGGRRAGRDAGDEDAGDEAGGQEAAGGGEDAIPY